MLLLRRKLRTQNGNCSDVDNLKEPTNTRPDMNHVCPRSRGGAVRGDAALWSMPVCLFSRGLATVEGGTLSGLEPDSHAERPAGARSRRGQQFQLERDEGRPDGHANQRRTPTKQGLRAQTTVHAYYVHTHRVPLRGSPYNSSAEPGLMKGNAARARISDALARRCRETGFRYNTSFSSRSVANEEQRLLGPANCAHACVSDKTYFRATYLVLRVPRRSLLRVWSEVSVRMYLECTYAPCGTHTLE